MKVFLSCCGIFLLIIDSSCAVAGARDGLDLCIRTAIPSLFPFFFLSVILTSALSGKENRWLRILGMMLHLPKGSESLLLIGLLGGYPVGAQAVTQAWKSKHLDRMNAQRMLGFCSNAGPSFLFGILGTGFSSPATSWILWLIHILSALLVGMLLPSVGQTSCKASAAGNITVSDALSRSVGIMAKVCGWVILFRVIISILDKWILWAVPDLIKIVFTGLLELTNGCCQLHQISNEGIRVILAACFLAFGGICVSMQTVSVCGDLGTGSYFPGKILQLLFSFVLSFVYQAILFPPQEKVMPNSAFLLIGLTAALISFLLLKKRKNKSSFPIAMGV